MRIVYVTSSAPLPMTSGGRLRSGALWQVLRRLGDVQVWVLGDRPRAAERRELAREGIRIWPARVERVAGKVQRYLVAGIRGESILAARYLSKRRIARLRETLAVLEADVVLLGDTYLATLLPHLRGLGRWVVVDTHNVESLLQRRVAAATSNPLQKLRYLWLARNTMAVERRFLPLADEVWAVSEDDARFYRQVLGLQRVTVVPNVLDISRYPLGTEDQIEVGAIVFTGWYAYWPNEDAALALIAYSRRLNREGIQHKLYLVGRDPTPAMYDAARGLPQVIITGEVASVQGYIARASVFAAPIRAGSGTKFKILEALALGRPVLTTSIGAEGLGLVSGRDALVVDDFEAYYQSLRRLLLEPLIGWDMGAYGRSVVEQRYSFAALEALLRDRLKQTR